MRNYGKHTSVAHSRRSPSEVKPKSFFAAEVERDSYDFSMQVAISCLNGNKEIRKHEHK